MRLHDFLDYHAREQGHAEFAVQDDRTLTYHEAQAITFRLARAFVEAGLQVGDRIAILSKNSIEYILLYLAAARAGVVSVPLNYRLAPSAWGYILNNAGASVLFASAEFSGAVHPLRAELHSVQRFVQVGDSSAGGRSPGWEAYQDWVDAHPAAPLEREVSPEDDVFQLYTSGTTGHPKGAVLTHRNVATHLAQIGLAHRIQPQERLLVVAPVFHVAAANAGVFPMIFAGGSLYIQADFKPAEVVRALSEERIGMTVLVPAMIQACLTAVPDAAERRYDALRLIHYGGSPIAEATLRRALEVFQCDFSQGYGMTEATGGITYLTAGDHRRALAENPGLLLSAGRPLPGTEIRIVDLDDRPLPNGQIGEIVVRGPQVMKEYWNQPQATAETLRGGWLHTGDAGLLDDEGYLYIHDRLKDMIVSGGENVYPRMVEEVLYRHPAVADAAVIGVPDPKWGETVMAILVLREGMPATEDEIIAFCKNHLGGFQCPRSVTFVESLPRTPSGKVLKRVLREPFWKDQARRVAGV